MEKERTVILKRKENIPYDFNINEEYKKYESIGDNKSELKTYKNWESHIINKCSQFTETTRLNFVHYIKGKKRSEENKIATLDAIWMPLNIFVLTVLLTFMFAFVELIKNYNAAASEIVTNYFVSNTDKLYEQTARLLEFNFKESIIFYGMFSVIILITGVQEQGCIVHCIGDLNQSIYEFKRVDPDEILKHVGEYKQKELHINFRSCKEIVALSERLINVNEIESANLNNLLGSNSLVYFEYDKPDDAINSYYKILKKFDFLEKENRILVRQNSMKLQLEKSTRDGMDEKNRLL